jgi:transcriptional regulator GlxA family with amidase domain
VDWFLLSFLARVVEGYAALDRPEDRQSGGLSPGNRRRVDEILENRISNGIALPDLARACGLSAGHFSRAFRATFGMTAHRRMMQLRIRRAQLLLRNSRQPIAAIAREVGFMDQAAFTKRFVEITGSTPGRYRRFAQAATVLSDFIQV